MIQCDECEVYFFLKESLLEHTGYCIGYNPDKIDVVINLE